MLSPAIFRRDPVKEKAAQKTDLWVNIIRWMIVIAFMLLPLMMSILNYDAYDLPKAVLLYALTLIAAVSYLAHSLQSGGFVIKRNPLNKPLLAFAVMMTIATIASPIMLISIIGEYARYENLPTIYGYIILCFFAGQFMNNKQWLNRLVSLSAISFGIMTIYGIFQHFGIDVLPVVMRGFEGRSRSTLGNPVFFGGYLAITIPLFLNYLIDKEEDVPYLPKWLIAVLLGLGFWAAIFSESRGAWFAILVGVVAVLTLRRRQLLRTIGITFSVIVVSTAVALTIMLAAGHSVLKNTVSSLGEKVSEINKPSVGSEASRIEIWKSSVDMVSVRPLEGYGPDQMYVWSAPFETLKDAQLEKNTISDRAHNIFLQVAINGGLISLLIFLWIIVILATVGFRLLRDKKPTSSFVIAALAALVGYCGQGLSGIDVIGITAPVWILGGSVAALGANKFSEGLTIPLKTKRHTEIIVVASLLASVLFIFSLKPLVADAYYLSGITNGYYNQTDRMISDYNSAVSLFPYQSQYRSSLVVALVSQGNSLKDPNLIERAISVADDGLTYNQNDFNLLLAQASAYRVYAAITDDPNQSLAGQAEQCYREAINLNPYSTNPRRGLLGLDMTEQKYPDAINQAKTILLVDPNDAEVKYHLAQAYEETGKYGLAKRLYSELVKQYPNRDDIRASLANLE